MKLILSVLFISSFAHASSYFWSCGDTVGSRYFWDRGVEAGSHYYWQKGDGPGSRYYWERGTGFGSKYYYLRNDGPWSNLSYQRGAEAGSYYFWNNGTGPGSRYFYERGTGPSADGVVTALCMQNAITHPLCHSIRNAPASQVQYCVSKVFDQFQQLLNTGPNRTLECRETSDF